MFSLCSNGLLCEAGQQTVMRAVQFGPSSERRTMMEKDRLQGRRREPGRPKGDPAAVRRMTIGVRVNQAEWEALRRKANHMGMSPAQWLRTAALARQLPPPPVPEANRAAYAELTRLAVNLNQIARAANEGRAVVSSSLLHTLRQEVSKLQRALLGQER